MVKTAEAAIGARLADQEKFDMEHTDTELCDEVFNKILLPNVDEEEEQCMNSAVLLLGESGSGKTHIIEYCLRKLQQAKGDIVVLRAFGGGYVSDVECVRHLATQVTDCFAAVPSGGASFQRHMDWLRDVLKDSFKNATSVVMVLDKFEHFCTNPRQTLLYNLFDIAQEVGVRLSIIATSSSVNVLGLLEKRIRSRFSMRCLHVSPPSTMEELVRALMSKLHVPRELDVKAAFVKQWNDRVQSALFAKREEWRPHVEYGRCVPWFLNRCLPVSRLIAEAYPPAQSLAATARESATERSFPSTPATPRIRPRDEVSEIMQTPPKRQCAELPGSSNWEAISRRGGILPEDARNMKIWGRSEAEHILILALFRLRRRANRTLGMALQDIERMYHTSGMVTRYNEAVYLYAFDNLVKLQLIDNLADGTTSAKEMRYFPCRPEPQVEKTYAALLGDLLIGKGLKIKTNPLKELPAPVINWLDASMSKETTC